MSSHEALFRLRSFTVSLTTVFAAAACAPADTVQTDTRTRAGEVATAYIEAYNDRDLDWLRELIAPDITYGGEDSDRQELIAAIQGFWEAFPDVALEPTHLVAEEEWAAIRIEFRGTHEGEFAEIEPTGEPIEGSEIMLFRIREGQITEYWYEWDELGFYEQLGAAEGR